MLQIGLTGGIGSGKSTVSQLLVERGAVLIDADAIVRELQEPGQPVFEAMVAEYGPEVVQDDGTLDRKAVAAIVFGDHEALQRLNAIVHPVLHAEIARRRVALAETDETVVLDLPLLVESGHSGFDGVVVVDIDPVVAVERLVEHRGFSRSDAEARIAAQVDRSERLAVADFVVDNNGSLAELEEQVERCWDWMCSLERPAPRQTIEPLSDQTAMPGAEGSRQ